MITRAELQAEGLDWLRDGSLLCQLDDGDVDTVLAEAEWAKARSGEVLIAHGSSPAGTWVIASGSLEVSVPRGPRTWRPISRLGPGHLVGERSAVTGEAAVAKVRALSPTRLLFLRRDRFVGLLDRLPGLREYVEGLVEIRERSDELVRRMASNKLLRELGPDDLDRVLQSARLVRCTGGTRLIEARSATRNVYLLLAGRVGVYESGTDPDQSSLLASLVPPELFGHRAVLLDRPRSADVVAESRCELLEIPGRAFETIVNSNPRARPRIYHDVAGLNVSPETDEAGSDGGAAVVVAVYGQRRALGSTTIAYGTAAALTGHLERPPWLIDMHLDQHAARWGLPLEEVSFGEIEAYKLRCPESWGGMVVVCPRNPDQSAALVKELSPHTGCVVVSADCQAKAQEEIGKEADAVVFVCEEASATWDVTGSVGQFRIHAVRTSEDPSVSQGQVRHVVRIPLDDSGPSRFWRRADLAALIDPDKPFGRACLRMGRVLRGRSVGVALGGGGAWGFAHVGLLRALTRAGVPIDYVSGSSFGAVVAGLYAAGGMAALERLVRGGWVLLPPAGLSVITTAGIGKVVDRLSGTRPMAGTEIPFLPMAADIRTAEPYILDRGTVGRGVRASSGMPGLFNPLTEDEHRLVDGGVVDNVPATVVWEAGADFVIASNVIPKRPSSGSSEGGMRLVTHAVGRATRRADDMLRAVYRLMWQNGLDRSKDHADELLNLGEVVADFAAWEFWKGKEIAARAEDYLAERMDDIVYAWQNDKSVHFGKLS